MRAQHEDIHRADQSRHVLAEASENEKRIHAVLGKHLLHFSVVFAVNLLARIIAHDKKADIGVRSYNPCRRLGERFVIFSWGDTGDHANYPGAFWEAELCLHGLFCLAGNPWVGRMWQNVNAVIDYVRAARRNAMA